MKNSGSSASATRPGDTTSSASRDRHAPASAVGVAAAHRARQFDDAPTVGDMESAGVWTSAMTSVDDMRGSVTAVTESASAALRRVRGKNGLLLLEMDVTGDLAEAPATTPVAALRGLRTLALRDVVRVLEKAAEDDRVAGLVAHG